MPLDVYGDADYLQTAAGLELVGAKVRIPCSIIAASSCRNQSELYR